MVSDVVFHEYGHGINDLYYESLGSGFNNGAMNEGICRLVGHQSDRQSCARGGLLFRQSRILHPEV